MAPSKTSSNLYLLLQSIFFLYLAFSFSGLATPHSKAKSQGKTAKAAQEILAALEKLDEREENAPGVCHGRLTLTSGTPVTTGDLTSSTVYFTPLNGNKISLWDGTKWQLFTFSEISVAVPSTTTLPFDIFAYNNSGTVALETTNWTSDTARATGISRVNGIFVRNAAATRRYLGTARTTTTSGQTEDSAANRLLWNNYNRMTRTLYRAGPANNYTYSTAAFRAANADSTARITLVAGLGYNPVHLEVFGTGVCAGASAYYIGIGYDSETASTGIPGYSASTEFTRLMGYLHEVPAIGYHYYQIIEYGCGSTTTLYTGSGYGGMIGVFRN